MSTGASWQCRACKRPVDIPEYVSLAFFDGSPTEGLAAIRSEQARHLSVCEAYLGVAGDVLVTEAEHALKEEAAS